MRGRFVTNTDVWLKDAKRSRWIQIQRHAAGSAKCEAVMKLEDMSHHRGAFMSASPAQIKASTAYMTFTTDSHPPTATAAMLEARK